MPDSVNRARLSRNTVSGRFDSFTQGHPNGGFRRIHVIAAHSGEGPFIVRFQTSANATAFDFRLRLPPTEYPTNLTLA